MQTADTNNYVASVVAPQGRDSIGRQQFEDARYQISQEAKMKLVQRVQQKSAAMDFYFGVVIMINLLLMGFEADLSDRNKMGPSNVFWWIESVILMIFCVELYIRLQILTPKLVTVTPEYYREQKSFLEDDEDTTTDYSAANTADLELMKAVKGDRNRMGEELKEVFDLVDVDKSGSLSAEEFRDAITNNQDVRRKVTNMRVQEDELDWLFEVLDADGSGKLSIQEFVTGVMKTRDSELACELMTMQNMILRELGKMEGHPKYKRETLSARKDTSTPRNIIKANNLSGVSTSAGEPGGAGVIVGVEGGSTHELACQEQHNKESFANDKVRVTGAPLKTTENASVRGGRPQRSFLNS
eukprot:g18857.t1